MIITFYWYHSLNCSKPSNIKPQKQIIILTSQPPRGPCDQPPPSPVSVAPLPRAAYGPPPRVASPPRWRGQVAGPRLREPPVPAAASLLQDGAAPPPRRADALPPDALLPPVKEVKGRVIRRVKFL